MVRIWAILDRYGTDAFREKTVLEVGCGDGSIGNFFYYLGAHVTCSDAREEFLAEVRHRNEKIRTVQCDLNLAWPFPGEQFDFVLHMGVLYHLERPDCSIVQACQHGKHLILDCEVTNCAGASPNLLPERGPDRSEDEIDDHAFEPVKGSRPTPEYIEKYLAEGGMEFEMLTDGKYDAVHPNPQSLAWPDTLQGYANGQRRMWFCKGIQ